MRSTDCISKETAIARLYKAIDLLINKVMKYGEG